MASDLEQALKIVMSVVGGPQAAAAIRSVEGTVKQAGTTMGTTSKAGGGLLSMLGVTNPGLVLMGTAAASAAAAMAFLGGSVRDAAEEQKGIRELAQAVTNTGVAYEGAAGGIETYLDAELRRVALDDGLGRQSIAGLTAITHDYRRALELMPVALDIAAGRHISLASATELVGKVAMGNMGILARYGIVLAEGATAAEAVAQLSAMYSGQAEAAVSGLEGVQQKSSVIWGNIREDLGDTLLPAAEELGEALIRALSGPDVQNAVKWAKQAIEDALSFAPGTTQAADRQLAQVEKELTTRQFPSGESGTRDMLNLLHGELLASGTEEQWKRFFAVVEQYQAQFPAEAAVVAEAWSQEWAGARMRDLASAQQTTEERLRLDDQVVENLRQKAQDVAFQQDVMGAGPESAQVIQLREAYEQALQAVVGFTLSEEQLAEISALTTQALGEEAAAKALDSVASANATAHTSALTYELMRQKIAAEGLGSTTGAMEAELLAAAAANEALANQTWAAGRAAGIFVVQGAKMASMLKAIAREGKAAAEGINAVVRAAGTLDIEPRGRNQGLGGHGETIKLLEDGAASVQSAWESAADAISGALQGIMAPTTSFDPQAWQDANGLRQDDWDEYARRGEDVVNLGNKSPWVADVGLEGLDDQAVRAAAAQKVEDFYAGALPNEINWQAVAQQLQEQVQSKLNWQDILAMAPEKLAEYGVSVNDADVLAAFGFDAAADGSDTASQFMDAFSTVADTKAEAMTGAGKTSYGKVISGLMTAAQNNGAGDMGAFYAYLVSLFKAPPTTPPTTPPPTVPPSAAAGPMGDL
ncbi:MAG: hypothetical protein ACYC5O_00860 [Anaerolineae bacterium]